jgi:hypothetical protein
MDVVVQIAFTPDGLPDASKDVLAGCRCHLCLDKVVLELESGITWVGSNGQHRPFRRFDG